MPAPAAEAVQAARERRAEHHAQTVLWLEDASVSLGKAVIGLKSERSPEARTVLETLRTVIQVLKEIR